MKSMLRMTLGVCAIAGFALAAVTDVQAACTRVSAQGEGLTKELATEMAKINLDFTIAMKGAKGAGPVQTKCGPGMLMLTACTSKQRACS